MMRIGYQGIPGAYSEAATIAFVREQLHVEINEKRIRTVITDFATIPIGSDISIWMNSFVHYETQQFKSG